MNLIEIAQRIRGDKDLGKGTCSHIDECFTDTELQKLIRETIDEIRNAGRRPIYKSIREVLYGKEVLWWEVEGIKWPSTSNRPAHCPGHRLPGQKPVGQRLRLKKGG